MVRILDSVFILYENVIYVPSCEYYVLMIKKLIVGPVKNSEFIRKGNFYQVGWLQVPRWLSGLNFQRQPLEWWKWKSSFSFMHPEVCWVHFLTKKTTLTGQFLLCTSDRSSHGLNCSQEGTKERALGVNLEEILDF